MIPFVSSITVDNTYDNIDNVVEVHNQHEDDYEPEETYIIPNCPPISGEESKQSATATRTNQKGKPKWNNLNFQNVILNKYIFFYL